VIDPDRPGDAVPSARPTRTPRGFEQRLLIRARAAGLGPGDRVVVAFSGGRDSLALAAAMRWVAWRLGIEPSLVHVDHALRDGSATEAARAVDLARALGLRCRIVRLEQHPTSVHRRVGLEEAARRERYRALRDAMSMVGASAVATAHHQQDQAETILLHLLRGSGVHGAAAMAEHTRLPCSLAPNDISPEPAIGWLWRPLLHEPRSAIDEYVQSLGLAPVEDPSNLDLSLRRNRVRHELLPWLEERFPGAVEALDRFAELAAEDDRLLDDLATAALSTVVAADGALLAATLLEQPRALQRRVMRRWLGAFTAPFPLSMERTEAVLRLARSAGGNRAIDIGDGWTIRRQRGMLRATREREAEGGVMSDGEPRAAGVARILIDDEALRRRIAELARALDEEYQGDVPLLVGVLNGAVTFMTDLMRGMTIPLEIDFMAVSSYGAATQSSGVVRILKDLDQEIEGRRVVVVEDIVDSGLTLQYLLDVLERRNPRDIRVVALLKKEKPNAIEVNVDQIGFTIPDEFVIGYGLDYAGKYRNLPYVAVLDPCIYAAE
jgi:hypoxanthine phosphoribosyltransferase